ncbi:LysR family transcriptional regulator [Vibrio sonorensis]|uniref:LysR family transcriptional regulator n=1 Tax=Vibrio sonorensis TaxID=1004316 RepID=UPI0008DA65F6|nr:LysR family transcriptional regulator [Vibrio sonorensis]
MDIDSVRAFCQLAQDGNFRVAAEHLFITQSALTKKIRRLESDIDLQLFERGRYGAVLTQSGKDLLPEAERLLQSVNQFAQYTDRLSQGTKGHLSIGFGISTYIHAPEITAKFKRRYPDVHISLNDMPSSLQQEKLLSGDLHLSFNRLETLQPPLRSITLFSDSLVIAVHEEVDIDLDNLWDSLSKQRYLQLNPERGKGLHRQITKYLLHHNHHLEAGQEADDILTLLALVSANLGYTILPASSEEISRKNIRLIPLFEEHSSWDIGLIWNDDKDNITRRHFVEFVSGLQSK